MVAEPVGAMAAGSSPAPQVIAHEGVADMSINQDSVNQLMEGAQGIEAAVEGVNEGTGIEAIKTVMTMMALVIRVLVRLCVDVSAHIGNFEAVVESKNSVITQAGKGHFPGSQEGL